MGRDWFISQGFTREEFELMKKWSGWAHTFRSPRDDSLAMEPCPPAPVDTKARPEHDAGGEEEVVLAAAGEGEVAGGSKPDDDNEDDGDEEHGNEHTSLGARRPAGISTAEMSQVGWMVKRVVDAGRVHFLRSHMGFKAHQAIYCAESLSPENVMLLACRR